MPMTWSQPRVFHPVCGVISILLGAWWKGEDCHFHQMFRVFVGNWREIKLIIIPFILEWENALGLKVKRDWVWLCLKVDPRDSVSEATVWSPASWPVVFRANWKLSLGGVFCDGVNGRPGPAASGVSGLCPLEFWPQVRSSAHHLLESTRNKRIPLSQSPHVTHFLFRTSDSLKNKPHLCFPWLLISKEFYI